MFERGRSSGLLDLDGFDWVFFCDFDQKSPCDDDEDEGEGDWNPEGPGKFLFFRCAHFELCSFHSRALGPRNSASRVMIAFSPSGASREIVKGNFPV